MNERADLKPKSVGIAEPPRTCGKLSEVMWQHGGLLENPGGRQTSVGSCSQKMRWFFLSKFEVSEIAQADANGHSCTAKQGVCARHRTHTCPPSSSRGSQRSERPGAATQGGDPLSRHEIVPVLLRL